MSVHIMFIYFWIITFTIIIITGIIKTNRIIKNIISILKETNDIEGMDNENKLHGQC